MKCGILPWLDEWNLRPGFPWQRVLEEQIENVKAATVGMTPDRKASELTPGINFRAVYL